MTVAMTSSVPARAVGMSRWKAASIHLALSATIATMVVLSMYGLWYPPPYFELMGGPLLVVLIVGCDVVLGPLITLIVFKSGKRGLKFDLATIAAFQLAALCYGLFTMFESRPVFTVWSVDRFEVMSPSDFKDENLREASASEFASLPLTGPRVVGARMPADPKVKEDLMFGHFGGDLASLPRFYVPYDQIAGDAAKKAKPFATLQKKDPAVTEQARRLAPGIPADRIGYLPVQGRFTDMTALVDGVSGRLFGIIEVSPW